MTTDLHLETFGDPADPTVLLVAGASASADWWDARLCRLVAEGGRHVVRYDHRDTGESPTDPPGAPSYPARRLVDDVVAVLDAVGAGAAHLVGLSMGGGLVQEVALRHPDRVATLTLVSTAAVGGVEAGLPGPSAAVSASFADPPPEPDWTDPDAVVEWWVAGETLFAGGATVDDRWLRATARRMVDRAHDVAASQNHWIVVGADGPQDAPALDARAITAPTLVVHGRLDPLFPPEHAEALADAVPGARLVLLGDVGHQAPQPAQWARFSGEVLRHTGDR